MKKSEIFFYHVNGTSKRQEIDLTPILRLIHMIKDEISSQEVEQFVIKSPYSKTIINEDGIKMIKLLIP